jgi:hypothetical protein
MATLSDKFEKEAFIHRKLQRTKLSEVRDVLKEVLRIAMHPQDNETPDIESVEQAMYDVNQILLDLNKVEDCYGVPYGTRK